jgi:hypothetical protein
VDSDANAGIDDPDGARSLTSRRLFQGADAICQPDRQPADPVGL